MLTELNGDLMYPPPALTPNASLLYALETQERQLDVVLMRLEAARRDLVPAPANFWRGSARHTYDAGIDALRGTVDAGFAAVRSARYRTAIAVADMVERDALLAAGGLTARVR